MRPSIASIEWVVVGRVVMRGMIMPVDVLLRPREIHPLCMFRFLTCDTGRVRSVRVGGGEVGVVLAVGEVGEDGADEGADEDVVPVVCRCI